MAPREQRSEREPIDYAAFFAQYGSDIMNDWGNGRMDIGDLARRWRVPVRELWAFVKTSPTRSPHPSGPSAPLR